MFAISQLRSPGGKKLKTVMLVTWVLLLTYPVLFVLPVRNVVLSYFIEYAWREISTYDLVRIHYLGRFKVPPQGLNGVVSCRTVTVPQISRNDINMASLWSYPKVQTQASVDLALSKQHGRFLPKFRPNERLDHLYLYAVLAERLNYVGIDHFLVAGSLLGVARHGGFIPWDDDLDVSVSLETWELVSTALSCVEGFSLTRHNLWHWKFHFRAQKFPFVDIFFYQMDDDYVWAAAWYIRKTFIYPTQLVFPLKWSTFEVLKVPVPKDGWSIVRRIYDFDTCEAYKGHVDTTNQTHARADHSGFSVTSLPCRELSYMYPLCHLGMAE